MLPSPAATGCSCASGWPRRTAARSPRASKRSGAASRAARCAGASPSPPPRADSPARLARPNPPGDLYNAPELRLLLLRGERVARLTGGEPALRTHRQALQRDVARRLAEARLHRARVLEGALLGGQEPEHHGRLRARVPERTEVTGAGRVVLEQQPVVAGETREDLAGDGLVAPVGQPTPARRVAAADVDGAGHAADALEDGVVDLRVGDQLGGHVVAPRLEGGAVFPVH